MSKLIIVESSIIKIDINGSVGLGAVNSNTIPITGSYSGTATLTVVYDPKVKINGDRIPTSIHIVISAALSGYSPTTSATCTITGNSTKVKCSNTSIILIDQTGVAIGGSCTKTSTPYTVNNFTGSISFSDAVQTKVKGE